MNKKYFSNGKLLITGEYVVLDGALALAVPTKFGQSLVVEDGKEDILQWTALNNEGTEWFKQSFNLAERGIRGSSKNKPNAEIENKLIEILEEANRLNPEILKNNRGFQVTTILEFPQAWGLGSSSTLINNIAQWFEISPYKLLENTFGGSGYDIAAAQHDHAITFQKKTDANSVLVAAFDPPFKNELFFVHLNQKQNSRNSIEHYRKQPKNHLDETIEKASSITQSFINCTSLEDFQILIKIHETLISGIINTPKIQSNLFPDFKGAIKSLGGWGGDFILVTGGEKEKDYFRRKGYATILGYEEMVK